MSEPRPHPQAAAEGASALPLWLEWTLAALAPLGWAISAATFAAQGRLPRPFQSNSAEALMDLYNTVYWANRDGAYDVWHSVYPPISFLFLRLISGPGCFAGGPYAARACDPTPAFVMLGVFALNAVLVFLSFRRSDRRRALPRAIALCGGFSMLYGLELANLILPCFTAFVLAEGELVRSRALRQAFRALAINFKPYLLVLAVPRLIQRRWGWLFGLAGAGLAIYLASVLAMGEGWPWTVVQNFYLYTLTLPDKFGINNHLPEIAVASGDAWRLLFGVPMRVVEVGLIVCFAAGALRPQLVDERRYVIMALSILSSEAALHTQGYSADYTMIFMLFVLFQRGGAAVGGKAAVLIAYLLCAPLDLTLRPVAEVRTPGFFAAREVEAVFNLYLSQFLRPALVVTLQVMLISACWTETISAGRRLVARLPIEKAGILDSNASNRRH